MQKKHAETEESSSLERMASSASNGSGESPEGSGIENQSMISRSSVSTVNNDEEIDWSKQFCSMRARSVESLQKDSKFSPLMQAHVGACDMLHSMGQSQTAVELLHYGIENEMTVCGSRPRCFGISDDSDQHFYGVLGNELQSKHDSAIDFPACMSSTKKDPVTLMLKELAEAHRSSHFHHQTQTV